MRIKLLTPRIIMNKLHQPGDIVTLEDNLARLYIQNKLGVEETAEATAKSVLEFAVAHPVPGHPTTNVERTTAEDPMEQAVKPARKVKDKESPPDSK